MPNLPTWVWYVAIAVVIYLVWVRSTGQPAPKQYPAGWWWPGKKR